MTAPDRDPPAWLRRIAAAARTVPPDDPTTDVDPSPQPAAVLVLFSAGDERGQEHAGDVPTGPDVLLIERAHDLRSHAGQPAFPGGVIDRTDDGPVAAALREAAEETGLDPVGVDVVACLPARYLAPTGYLVTPVVAWWRHPSPVSVVDATEVASVHRVPLAELLDPANRGSVRHPSGYVGPAFEVGGLLVWGFTAGLLARLLALSGLERPWDAGRRIDLPPAAVPVVRPARGSVA